MDDELRGLKNINDIRTNKDNQALGAHKTQTKIKPEDRALAVRVQPGAGKNAIVEIQSDGVVRIRLKAPPVAGRANQELIVFLADVLHFPATRITIMAGRSSRNKLVKFQGLDPDAVRSQLAKLAP